MLLNGKVVRDSILGKLKKDIDKLDRKLSFVVIQIGNDNISDIYIRSKERVANELGIIFNYILLDSNISNDEVLDIIDKNNNDDMIDGIMIELPVPSNIDYDLIRNRIKPSKDIEGISDINMGNLVCGNYKLVSPTALAVMDLLEYYSIDVVGVNVVIVGRSNLVGKPLFNLLINKGATVTMCHSKTKDLSFYTKKADILISCVGKSNFINGDMVKDDSIIIDVGTNIVDNKLCGDVDFASVYDKVKGITPVPLGIGSITSIELVRNVYIAYKIKKGIE